MFYCYTGIEIIKNENDKDLTSEKKSFTNVVFYNFKLSKDSQLKIYVCFLNFIIIFICLIFNYVSQSNHGIAKEVT